MSSGDLLRFASGALLGHRLRTGLSLLGMAIGVAAVVVLTALGEGARLYVTEQFTQIGTNLVIVLPGRNETTGLVPGLTGVPNDLTLSDARAIARQIPRVVRVAPLSVATETVALGERRRQVAIFGTTSEYLAIRQLRVARGEFLPQGEWDRGSAVTVLGSETAHELFGKDDPVGRVVRIGGWRMRVIGVMASKGVQLGVDVDDMALVPVATAMKMFNRTSLFRVVLEMRSHRDLEPAKQRVRALLTERHGEEDVTCVTQDAVVSTFSSILGALTLVLGAIGAISLSVAGVGIMNVTLVSVSERTSEIGLLKAVGARPRQILSVFLTEAALLSLLGGLLGLLVGSLAVQALTHIFPEMPARSPIWAVTAAFGLSIAVGLVFGVWPAKRATRLDPVTALMAR